MIDTLRLCIKGDLHRNSPSGTKTSLNYLGDRKNPIRVNPCKGFHGWFNVEFSVPRVLYGENGILIKTQEELDKSLREVQDYLNREGIEYDWNSRYITRIDLCSNFPREFTEVYGSYRYCNPSGIRFKNPMIKEGESITWGSKKSEIKFKMYDKGKEVNGVKSKDAVTRVELVLGKEALNKYEYLGDGSGRVRDIKFDRCLKVYREYLSKLMPSPYEVTLTNKGAIIARYSQVCPKIEGKSLEEAYYTNPRTRLKAIQSIEVSTDRFKKIDLMEGWSEGEFPKSIDIRKENKKSKGFPKRIIQPIQSKTVKSIGLIP